MMVCYGQGAITDRLNLDYGRLLAEENPDWISGGRAIGGVVGGGDRHTGTLVLGRPLDEVEAAAEAEAAAAAAAGEPGFVAGQPEQQQQRHRTETAVARSYSLGQLHRQQGRVEHRLEPLRAQTELLALPISTTVSAMTPSSQRFFPPRRGTRRGKVS
jgi:hypothetical protein